MIAEQISAPVTISSGVRTPAYSPPLEPELELHEVWEGLMRRRRLIASLTLLGLLTGLIYAFAAHKQFSATATVEFAQPSTHSLGFESTSDNAADLATVELLNTELKTQQMEINDDNTALAVIQQLHLTDREPFAIPADLSPKSPLNAERGLPLDRAPYQRERVMKIFQEHLTVEIVKGTRLLSVAYTDADPERAAQVANGVVNASIQQSTARRYTAVSQISSWLTDQLGLLKARVQESQRAVVFY